MSRTERDGARVVRSWLEEGADRIPDRVLDAVEARLHATRQRRAGWLARRFPIMNYTTVRYGIAAVVVIVVALFGFSYISPNIAGPQPDPTPTPAPTATPTPPPLGTIDALDPGRYAVPVFTVGVTVDVPSGGWSSNNGWVLIGPRGNEEPDGMAIRFMRPTSLYRNPGSADEGIIEVGPSADDLVQAILDHPTWDASGPTDITIDGYAGQMVELTIPSGAQMTAMDQFLIFGEPGGGQIYGWAPGQTFDLYIVDVRGDRLVFDAFHFADTPEADLAAQRAVIDSIRFDPSP